jgi:hypothetical protein
VSDSAAGQDRLRDPDDAPTGAIDRLKLVSAPNEMWRLHWEKDPRAPKSFDTGRYRFDAPHGEYLVTYTSSAREGTIAEVYGDLGRIKGEEATRRLTMITATRPLQLIALDDPRNQKRLGVDGRIGDAKQYRTTQRWSAYLHGRRDADGIRYRSRHAGGSMNLCLFLDRCAGDLVLHPEGTLQALRSTVLEIADRYEISVYLPRPRPGGRRRRAS